MFADLLKRKGISPSYDGGVQNPRFALKPQFNESFTRALKTDAEVRGAVQEKLDTHVDAYQKWHKENADEVHERGYKSGYTHGVQAAGPRNYTEGYIEGRLHGWDEAKLVIDEPRRLYDLTPAPNKSLKEAFTPIASAPDLPALSAKLEDTKANRLWRVRTGATDTNAGKRLNTIDKFIEKDSPFEFHKEYNRFAVDLSKFKHNTFLEGYDGHVTEQGSSVAKKLPPMARETAIKRGLSKSLAPIVEAKDITIPPREETRKEEDERLQRKKMIEDAERAQPPPTPKRKPRASSVERSTPQKKAGKKRSNSAAGKFATALVPVQLVLPDDTPAKTEEHPDPLDSVVDDLLGPAAPPKKGLIEQLESKPDKATSIDPVYDEVIKPQTFDELIQLAADQKAAKKAAKKRRQTMIPPRKDA